MTQFDCIRLCQPYFSAKNSDGTTINYEILSKTDLTCEVCAIKEYSGSVVIPSSVCYKGKQYSVTSIGYCAFEGCSRLKSVTIPSCVTVV